MTKPAAASGKRASGRPPTRSLSKSAMLAALSESEARMRAVLETAVEGIITIDHRGAIESVNRAAERIFGYRAAELLGRNVSSLMPSPYREAHDGYLSRYLQHGHPRIIGIGREVVGLRKDGSVFPMDLSVSEVKLPGRRIFTGFVRDVTDRKRLEAEILTAGEQERLRLGHDLHDGLGQHLAAIEMMSQVLHRRLVARGLEEATHAAEISENVRDTIAQARALARGLAPVIDDERGLMSALFELAAQTQKRFGVRCDFSSPKPLVLRDHQASIHLFRIAQEAVSNAIKHGHASRVTIRVSQPGSELHIAVRDNGAGLPRDSTPASGMGLRIMRFRAHLLGGRITLRTRSPRGTELLCQIPAPRP